MKLAELWAGALLFNVIGILLLATILTAHGVLPEGSGTPVVELTEKVDQNSLTTAFLSALAGGALITILTWLLEGSDSLGVRVLTAWVVGFLLFVTTLNHVIVGAAELFFGIRYGARIGWGDYVENLVVAAVGNIMGGLLFVTLTRFGQAVGSAK